MFNRALISLCLALLALVPASEGIAGLSFGNPCLKIKVEGHLRDAIVAPETERLDPAEFATLPTPTMTGLLTKKLNSQAGGWQEGDIAPLINSVPSEHRGKAKDLFHRMSRLGNMEATFEFAEWIPQYAKQEKLEFLTFGQGTLVDTVDYLGAKLKAKGAPPMRSLYESGGKSPSAGSKYAVLLDGLALRIIEGSPEIQNHIKSTGIRLLTIPGLVDGITVLNQGNKSEIQATFKRNLDKVIEGRDGDAALLESTRERLEKIGLDQQLDAVTYQPGSGQSKDLSVSTLLDRVTPQKLRESDVSKAFEDLEDEGVRHKTLSTFYEEAYLMSTSSMAESSRSLHAEVKKHAADLGVAEADLYYLAPTERKSYQLVLGIYAEANNIPADRILSTAEKMRVKGKTVVVLDDFVGTGDSLVKQGNEIEMYGGTPILAAHVATDMGASSLLDPKKKGGFRTVVGKRLSDIRQSSFYQNLPEAEKTDFNRHFEGGYGGYTKVAFEYMSPDNNVGTFSKTISPLYTLRKEAIQ